jgi:hypothetical protein
VQAEVARNLEHLERRVDLTDEAELLSAMLDWTNHAVANDWVPVSSAKDVPHFYVITDASKDGFAAIFLSPHGYQSTLVYGEWPPELAEFVQHSVCAEPLCLYVAYRAFFHHQGVHARVTNFTDNTYLKAIMTKGYTTAISTYLQVQERIAMEYPFIDTTSIHTPGESIPADRPSRGKAIDAAQLRQFCIDHGIEAHPSIWESLLTSDVLPNVDVSTGARFPSEFAK